MVSTSWGIALRLPFRVGEQYRVSQGYCKDGWSHTGYEVDFAMPPGTPVVAVSAGTVVQLGTYADTCTDMETKCGLSGFEQGGLFVKLQHPASEVGQAWYSSYLHLSTQSVALGQQVAAGEIIGLSGNTGLSSGPHLHFQVREGPADNPLNNPVNHLGVRPTPMTGLETDTGANPVTTFTESFWYRATGAPTFSVGDSVQVFSRAVQGLTPLPVRSEACGTEIASKADGQSGVIIGGPAFCEDYTRWQVRWSDGVEGWSGQNGLRPTVDPWSNLIVNGSFELPGFPTVIGGPRPPGQREVDAPADIGGWTVAGSGDVFLHKTPDIDNGGLFSPSHDGIYYLDLSGSGPPHASVLQDFATVPGAAYTLAFYIAGTSASPGPTINVELLGATTLVQESLTPPASYTTLNWGRCSYAFVANSAATRLTFVDTSASDDNASFLDNVSVRRSCDPCAGASITPANRSHGPGAETGSIAVAAGSGCAWTATPSAGWISITSGGSGSGNGTVNYSLSANASTATRGGTIAVAGKVFALTPGGSHTGDGWHGAHSRRQLYDGG